MSRDACHADERAALTATITLPYRSAASAAQAIGPSSDSLGEPQCCRRCHIYPYPTYGGVGTASGGLQAARRLATSPRSYEQAPSRGGRIEEVM